MSSGLDQCPNCKANLVGGEMPENIRHHYEGSHWKREIGIYDTDEDRTVKWQCPDCKHEWKA
jgi:predicted Zn-ribbon and HTH transcriptional regulator